MVTLIGYDIRADGQTWMKYVADFHATAALDCFSVTEGSRIVGFAIIHVTFPFSLLGVDVVGRVTSDAHSDSRADTHSSVLVVCW